MVGVIGIAGKEKFEGREIEAGESFGFKLS
jgi:hypothetical protein